MAKEGQKNVVLNSEEKQYEKKIIDESTEILKLFKENRGYIRRGIHNFRNLFIFCPRREVYHDWLFAFSFFVKIIKTFSARGEQDVSAEEKSILITVLVYLRLAKSERDFARAWSYVNLAITHLVLIVDAKDLDAFEYYLDSDVRNLLCSDSEINNSFSDEKKTLDASGIIDQEKMLFQPNFDDEKINKMDRFAERKRIHSKLLKLSSLWNNLNSKTSFKLSLLRSVGFWLFFSLVASLFIAEMIVASSFAPVFVPSQYFVISALGFFGGGLSAFFIARKAVINSDNNAMIRLLTVLRMLLGAAGSFVVYVILQWQPLKEISEQMANNHAAFITIGIVAGFSERFFLNSLARISGELVGSEGK